MFDAVKVFSATKQKERSATAEDGGLCHDKPVSMSE